MLAGLLALPAGGAAQAPFDTSSVSVAGAGATTWVLVSGTVGGIAGFRRLEARLLSGGDRVLIVDAYRLSADSADLSFAALARRVDAVLERHGVSAAHVVGHAHGGGIALRLASVAPERVATLTLVDVGAIPGSGSTVLRASLRLVPILARVPGGRGFLRDRFARGLRESAGRTAWLDSATVLAYTAPLLADVDRAVAMAARVAAARETEPVAQVVARVRAPLLVILGSAPRQARPSPEELAALAPLGARLRVEQLPGVGHFVHEEAPDEVMRLLQLPRLARAGAVEGSR